MFGWLTVFCLFCVCSRINQYIQGYFVVDYAFLNEFPSRFVGTWVVCKIRKVSLSSYDEAMDALCNRPLFGGFLILLTENLCVNIFSESLLAKTL